MLCDIGVAALTAFSAKACISEWKCGAANAVLERLQSSQCESSVIGMYFDIQHITHEDSMVPVLF